MIIRLVRGPRSVIHVRSIRPFPAPFFPQIRRTEPVGVLETSVGTTLANSSFSCSFKRPIRIVKEEISYDLSTQNFFILTAAGSQSRNVRRYLLIFWDFLKMKLRSIYFHSFEPHNFWNTISCIKTIGRKSECNRIVLQCASAAAKLSENGANDRSSWLHAPSCLGTSSSSR